MRKAANLIQEALLLGNERYGVWFSAMHLIVDLEDHHVKTEQQREAEFAAHRQADIDALLELLSQVDVSVAGQDEKKS